LATPAEIRRQRKEVLRKVKASLRILDSSLEKVERKINRTLGIKKRFPDSEDALEIMQGITTIDKNIDGVFNSAKEFTEIVQVF
jgi:hypothetical protein